MQHLAGEKRIDLTVPTAEADPRFSTDYLFGEARGQMFGVLVCEETDGSISTIKAFSGQYDGVWEVEGWAPPLFDVAEFNFVSYNTEKRIKQLTRQIENPGIPSLQKSRLMHERKKLSQQLMRDIHGLYRVHNFQGRVSPLQDIFDGRNGMPTGTGDCCAPKLLNHAARNGLKPLGLAEFYWGRENKSGSCQHGSFYPSCEAKCQPILGFMLCGLDNK